ncbi:MAG: hypothetical protein J5747_11105 [Spirochaetaceae bacterium]|nr:hypothetical protein [Spirochaetaceae bacterium]
MKKLLLLCFIILLCSCKTNNKDTEDLSYNYPVMIEQITQRRFDTSKALEEMSRERSENKIPFTMNFQDCLGKPVIEFDTENHIYMQVDTGYTKNWYFNSFINKMNITDAEFIEKIVEEIRNNLPELSESHSSDEELIAFLKEEWAKYNLNDLVECIINGIDFLYDPNLTPSFDAVLGEEFLMRYDRVTFDFVENYIILNDEKLDGTAIPFIQTPNKEILINFLYDGKQELAMIDTGNYCFTPRHNIGDGKQNYDINDYSSYLLEYKGEVPVTPRVMQTYDNIRIGDVVYNNIKGAYSTIAGSGFGKGSKMHFIKLNNLGNVFFYDHIIQFDFVDKVFIIK